MKWFKRIVLATSLTLLVIGAASAFFGNGPIFEVSSIPVEFTATDDSGDGIFKTDVATLTDLEQRLRSRVQKFERRRIWEISIDELGKALQADGWVQSVRISRWLPNGLSVLVTPRAPAFFLVPTRGKPVPVAADGTLVADFNPLLLPNVPVLRGDGFLKDSALRLRAIALLRELPAEGPLSRFNVAEVTWTNESGFTVVVLPSRTPVLFGKEQISLKAARVEKILDYLSANQLDGRIGDRVIDASFSKKVLVRLRKGP